MIAYKVYENNIIFSISKNVMHHFRKSKVLFISLKFAFSSVQTVYVLIKNYFVPVTFLPSQIDFLKYTEQMLLFKMVPSMNGFVNWLLKNWTIPRSFQMPLVLS